MADRWGAEFALQGARMRIARAHLVAGQAEPAPRDPRGGGFDPGDAAAFAAASAPVSYTHLTLPTILLV